MDIGDIEPTELRKVMDLVAAAGIDVSDWGNGKGNAASNPKYCFEWSYEDPDKQLLVLNLWHKELEQLGGSIIQWLNLNPLRKGSAAPIQVKRAEKRASSLKKAACMNWPLRVIICDRSSSDGKVERRSLDDELWHIQSYEPDTGDCLLVRGEKHVDQFKQAHLLRGATPKKETTTSVYKRSSLVRNHVLVRANGYCEWCGAAGFKTVDGLLYLETHHIQPLSENGADTVENVIALCPNHHREAHFGQAAQEMRHSMLEKVSGLTLLWNQKQNNNLLN